MKNLIIKNKKGYSMGGWTEGILLSMLIVMILGIVIGGFNVMYGKDNQIGLGTNTSKDYIAYQSTLEREIAGGEAVFDAKSGLTLKSSWGIITAGINIIWDFLTGGWIETIIIKMMKLPAQVALIFRILYFLSIGFIILKILFKVRP